MEKGEVFTVEVKLTEALYPILKIIMDMRVNLSLKISDGMDNDKLEDLYERRQLLSNTETVLIKIFFEVK